MVRKMNTRRMVRNEITKALAETSEVKHQTNQQAFNASFDRPTAYNLVDYIQQGDTATSRTGNRVNLLSINMRGDLDMPASLNQSRIRIAIVETRQPLPLDSTGNAYDARGIFENNTLLKEDAFFDMDLVKKIYFNRKWIFNALPNDGAGAAGTAVPITKDLSKYIKFGKLGKKIYYDGNTSSTLGQNTNTHLYVVAIGSDPASQVDLAGGTFVWKTRFTDA